MSEELLRLYIVPQGREMAEERVLPLGNLRSIR